MRNGGSPVPRPRIREQLLLAVCQPHRLLFSRPPKEKVA